MSKESFKAFASLHPELASSVHNNKATWQELYDIYEIYGPNHNIWNNYLSNNSIKDTFNSLKGIDMEEVQKGVENLKKTVTMLQSLTSKGFNKDE